MEGLQSVKPSPSSDYPFAWRPDGTETPRPDEKLPGRPPAVVRKAAWLSALEWAILVVAALTVALLIKTFLFQAFYIPSESMVPTLQKNDRVLVNKMSYRLHDVHRGDVVVFKAPPGVDPNVKDLVKRVIGLPGEKIEARDDGYVYVNGKRLTEDYLPEGVRTEPGFAPIRIPKDAYWVMGDNRGNSKDSRLFPQHFIHKNDIVGRVFVRIWPLNRLDRL
jgi:signal peptidase I